ncbi:MAG: hypothetical protein RR049_05880 [Angelakisella sp.]
MDSMAEKLEQLLNDENTVSQIQQILSSLREGGGISQPTGEAEPQGGGEGGINPAMMKGLLNMLPMSGGGASGGDDPNVELLRALRPFLSTKRKKKVSEAVKMMKLMDMLPMITQSGLLSGFLGGDEDE